jgi:hypothetical protein
MKKARRLTSSKKDENVAKIHTVVTMDLRVTNGEPTKLLLKERHGSNDF